MGQQSDIYLSNSVLGVSLVVALSIHLWVLCNSTSYCLTCGKKKREDPKRKKKTKDNNKPLVDFKLFQWVLLVFLDDTGRGELGFAFLSSVLREWESGLRHNISNFPASGLGHPWAAWLKSATQLLTVWVSLCTKLRQVGCKFCSATVSGHTVPD